MCVLSRTQSVICMFEKRKSMAQYMFSTCIYDLCVLFSTLPLSGTCLRWLFRCRLFIIMSANLFKHEHLRLFGLKWVALWPWEGESFFPAYTIVVTVYGWMDGGVLLLCTLGMRPCLCMQPRRYVMNSVCTVPFFSFLFFLSLSMYMCVSHMPSSKILGTLHSLSQRCCNQDLH